MWQSVGLTLLVIVATIVCALLFMLFGEFVDKEKHLQGGKGASMACLTTN